MLEVLVALIITSLMLPAIGLAFYQLLRVPPQESDELTTINEVSLALGWMNKDGMMAQYFSSAPDERDPYFIGEYLYGAFYWVDRTSGNVSHCYAVRYYYDDGYVMRREWQDNAPVSTITIARHIADYGNISFDFHPHGNWPQGNFSKLGLPYVAVTTKATEQRGNAVQWAEGTQYIYLRGGESLSRGFAVLALGTADDAIGISGKYLTIDGDIRSYGDISISGSDHSVTGWAQARGEIDDGAGAGAIPNDQEESNYPLKDMGWNLEVEDFQQYTFNFTGDKSLSYPNPAGCWLNKTTLKPGVYYTTGTMTLATDNATGMVTLIGDKVVVTADNTKLTPFCNGVLLYGTGSGAEAIKFSEDGGTWYGTLFARDGEVKITGSDLTLYGAIAAQTFTYENSDEGVRIEF